MIKTACLFVGQGSQYVGMAKSICQASKAASEVFEKASGILGYDLKALCDEGPEEKLKQTRYCQPAILATSVACFAALKERLPELEPVCGAGLSLGEFSALVASGTLSVEDGIELIRNRAEFMEEAATSNPGSMASIIGMDADKILEICNTELTGVGVANLNCPDQTVVTGTVGGIKNCVEVFEKHGAKRVVVLEVGGAFHSPMMDSAAEKLGAVLEKINFAPAAFPVISNTTALPHEAETIKPMLVKQMVSSVLWEKSVRYMSAQGAELFVELGCGRVLMGLNRRIDRSFKTVGIQDAEGLDNVVEKISQLG